MSIGIKKIAKIQNNGNPPKPSKTNGVSNFGAFYFESETVRPHPSQPTNQHQQRREKSALERQHLGRLSGGEATTPSSSHLPSFSNRIDPRKWEKREQRRKASRRRRALPFQPRTRNRAGSRCKMFYRRRTAVLHMVRTTTNPRHPPAAVAVYSLRKTNGMPRHWH